MMTTRLNEPTDMPRDRQDIQPTANANEVAAFLRQVAATPVRPGGQRPGRLIFAMDATASREPSWDRACEIQAEMFSETRHLGGLEVQLVFYRGFCEFEASAWYADPSSLLGRMTRVSCAGGLTQIARVLRHAQAEHRRGRVNALVFVGDCMEESRDELAGLAGQLGVLGVPGFFFQEGRDTVAEQSFREMARLSGGAWCPFDSRSPELLRDLLSAVAVFATGGRQALEALGHRRGGAIRQLTHQIGKGQ